MPLRVNIANRDEADVLRRLGQLYLHELCRFSNQELNDDGTFDFPHMEDSFREVDKYGYIVRLKGKVAGFVLVRTRETHDDKEYSEITDLFVVETYRRVGVGEEAARMIFDLHEGLWRITTRSGYDIGSTFWRKVVRRFAHKAYREFRSPDVEGTVYEFSSPAPVLAHQHESVLDRPILKVSLKQPG